MSKLSNFRGKEDMTKTEQHGWKSPKSYRRAIRLSPVLPPHLGGLARGEQPLGTTSETSLP